MNDQKNCTHCNEPIVVGHTLPDNNEAIFCCHGCMNVFEILQEKKLTDYYKLREDSGVKEFGTIKSNHKKFGYLDDEHFQNQHIKTTDQTKELHFYLEGIHCLACLWLLEKLSIFNQNILSTELNMSQSILKVIISRDEKFSEVAFLLNKLGYTPHPILEDSNLSDLKKKEDQKDLIRIVISFFCAGNIMLLAFSNYAGTEGIIRISFEFFSFLLFLPILLYSALPFYKSAYNSIKFKNPNLDLPIVFALLMGTILGLYSLYFHKNYIYFDSLATLVFLLLTSRFILKKAQHSGMSATEISSFFTNLSTIKIENGIEKEIHSKYVAVGDILIVNSDETIPCDGIVIDGNSTLNASLLTGETKPIYIEKNSEVFSGTINTGNPIKIKVTKDSKNSKLGTILTEVESGWNNKTQISTLTDQIAKYFILSVFVISIICFLYFAKDGLWEEAILRTLSIIIITCPCALGMATPLTLSLTLSKLSRIGIIVKNASVIEKITKAQNVFFDKTGTLTYGNLKVENWETINTEANTLAIIYSLEKKSKHPIAQSLKSYIEYEWIKNNSKKISLEVRDLEEVIGSGISGIIGDNKYEITSDATNESNKTKLVLMENSIPIANIYLSDMVRENAKLIVDKIKLLRLDPFLVSGDADGPVYDVGLQVKIPRKNIFSKHDPNAKLNLVKHLPQTIFIGDGANDALALSQSLVGIAVHGGVDISMRASDVFMAKNDLNLIIRLIESSKESLNIIYRNLNFSFLFNIVGIYFAVKGDISPLFAAILMPLSSLTIVISSIIGNRKWRSSFKQ